MTNSDGRGGSGSGWSPELLTVLGAVLAVGVALATLIFTGLDQVRSDMQRMETLLREDTRELRSDVGQVRERVSNLEGRLVQDNLPPKSL